MALNKRDEFPLDHKAIGYVQTLYFDMEFNYIRGSVEQAVIGPGAPTNWESESCKVIPYVWYEYTRVSKKNPETSRTGRKRIDQALKKVKFFASMAKGQGSVLRIVKDAIVTKLYPDKKAVGHRELYLEESYGSLITDSIASSRKTREIPPHLKKKGKAASHSTKRKR